jgi:carbon storage regulator CsrA
MIVLTRKEQEGLVIGKGFVIKVMQIGEDEVHLGIVVPQDVPVHRLEDYDLSHGGEQPGPESPSPE